MMWTNSLLDLWYSECVQSLASELAVPDVTEAGIGVNSNRPFPPFLSLQTTKQVNARVEQLLNRVVLWLFPMGTSPAPALCGEQMARP